MRIVTLENRNHRLDGSQLFSLLAMIEPDGKKLSVNGHCYLDVRFRVSSRKVGKLEMFQKR